MSTPSKKNNRSPFLYLADESVKLFQEKDWSNTIVGEPHNWPVSLSNSLNIILSIPLPMLLFWGDQKICFYNNAFINEFATVENERLFGEPLENSVQGKWKFLNEPLANTIKGDKDYTIFHYQIPKSENTEITHNWNFKLSTLFDDNNLPAGALVTCLQVGAKLPVDAEDVNAHSPLNISKALEKKEAETIAIIENSMFPIAVIKVGTMEILRANEVIIKAWGKGKQVIGKKYSEVLPELEAQEIFKYFNQVAQTGKAFTAFNQKVDLIKNGISERKYFNYSFAPLKDENGATYAILNTAADITEIIEAKLKEENTVNELKLFKFMADNAADKLILIRKDASFAYLNKKVLSKWGYSKSEVSELSVFDIDTLYNRKDFDLLFEKSFEKNSIQFETNHKNKKGEIFPVEVSSTGLMLDGEPYIFVIARDITDRKKAEEEIRNAFAKIEDSERRFRDSVKQAPLGIAIFKGDDYIAEMANNDYYKIIDRTEDQFLNKPLFEALPEMKKEVEPIFKEIFKTGKAYHSYEFPATLKKKEGYIQNYFNLVYHPLKDDIGRCTGIMVVAIDITENVIAKMKLQESERQFRNMIMQSPVSITILRGDNFVIEMANKAMLDKIMIKEKAEVIGQPILQAFPELAKQHYKKILRELYKQGGSKKIEEAPLELKVKGGMTKLMVDITFTVMPATGTTAAGIMITANDVTDKVDARKNVEDSNERLRLATEAAEMGTWELDLQNRTLIHSPRLSEIFGENSSFTFDFDYLRSKIFKKDIEEVIQPALEKALQSGYYFYEARIRKFPESFNWIRTQGKVVFDENKVPLKMIGTTVDITAEKLFTERLEKSEERFRLLANEIPQLIWTANARGEIIYYNEAVYNYSGLSKGELMNGGWLRIVHPQEKEENERLWIHSISKGTDFLYEHRFRKADGTYRWQLSRAIPQRNELGEIQAWVGSSTDIQEIKEQEEQKDFFISMASHELKTPVTSIKGYVQILQSLYEKSEDSFLKESLKVVDRQIITLTKLISELLDISKIKSGGLEIKKEAFEMPDLIREVVQQIKHTSPQYPVSMHLVAEAKVFADKDRIGQVLINLLTNAIKYAPNATNIEVSCSIENDRVRISIKDEGIGISKKDQEKIFERFYRVEGKNEQTYPGFGIGLFIASDILKKHNGHIIVESEIGQGSKFSFFLPIYK